MSGPGLRRELNLLDVVLLNVIVIFSLRGMATGAKMGPAAILLWLLAVGAFFVPLGYTLTELATRDPGEGGFYRWTRAAFGDVHGFMCAWLYWVTNLTYLPSLLIFLAGNVVFVIGREEVGESPAFVLSLSLTVLWLTTYFNVRGWRIGKRFTGTGAAASWLAAVLLIAAGAVALWRSGSLTSWTWSAVESSLREPRTLAYFGTLSFALVGLELAPIMGDEIVNPRRTLPRAILISGAGIALLYLLGTAAIMVAVASAEVHPISGGLGAVQDVGDRMGWGWLPVLTAALVSFSAVGGVLAWIAGQARLPYAVGIDRFVPPVMAKLHPRHGTPHVSIILQSALASLLMIISQAGAGVREAYLLLLDMTIVMNFIPFVYIFLALPRLRRGEAEPGVVRVPGGRGGVWLVAGLGLLATLLTLATSVVPPSDVADPRLFELKLWGGLVAFVLLGLGVFRAFR